MTHATCQCANPCKKVVAKAAGQTSGQTQLQLCGPKATIRTKEVVEQTDEDVGNQTVFEGVRQTVFEGVGNQMGTIKG